MEAGCLACGLSDDDALPNVAASMRRAYASALLARRHVGHVPRSVACCSPAVPPTWEADSTLLHGFLRPRRALPWNSTCYVPRATL
eukprot:15077-Chlamydomonas_euryale.AAC.4